MNDGSLRVLDAQGRAVFHILVLSVKEDFGAGTGDPAMDIGASYGWHMSQQYWQPYGPAAPFIKTCCPAFGLALVGNVFWWVSQLLGNIFRWVSRGCYSCWGTSSGGSHGGVTAVWEHLPWVWWTKTFRANNYPASLFLFSLFMLLCSPQDPCLFNLLDRPCQFSSHLLPP